MLDSSPTDSRPDAVLVIESGCFVGYGIEASGPVGLYGLSLAVNHELNKLGHASPDLNAHVQDGPAIP